MSLQSRLQPADASAPPRPTPPASRARAAARRHRLFLCVLTAGVLLRVVVTLGYRPLMWFPDSDDYLSGAVNPNPNLIRPSGYSLFLWLLKPFHSLPLVGLAQHALGVGIAVLLYTLLRRRVAPWLAALATAPLLLDGDVLQFEHLLMSDTLFTFLVMAAVAALLRPGHRWTVAAGALLGLATITRSAGLPLLLLLALYLLVRRAGWRVGLAAVTAGAVPVIGYSSWFAAQHGEFTLTRSTGVFLYGRVAPFADCRTMRPPVEEMPLCLAGDPAERSVYRSYIWGPGAARHRLEAEGFGTQGERYGRSFAVRAILAQPGDYLRVAGTDVARTFRWTHPQFPDATTYGYYLFKPGPAHAGDQAERFYRRYDAGYTRPHAVQPYARFLGAYQQTVYLPGTLLGVVLLIGAVRIVRERRDLGGERLLPWTIGVTLLVVPAFTAQFDYRYVMPAVPLLLLAAAMGSRDHSPTIGP
ncbi:hypothetical protein [Actinomadura macrotermitis]|uniref:Glycosyltransferase RgtA/B/C/D-like domain-containing protein n=1 Tax=Actinomadura macrotermitis TaxID=2585200 RepID=A0A7K0C0U0_9ACTN|nr:hypothetical protein [Actinomadura macrotermitis]MQY07078.1 hypothetical protein [Actinomadura macrotermitis]